MYERSHVSIKVEPRLTSRFISTLYILPLFYLRFTCVNVRNQKRVSVNQPLDLGQFEQPNNLIIVELTFL